MEELRPCHIVIHRQVEVRIVGTALICVEGLRLLGLGFRSVLGRIDAEPSELP